MLEESEFLESCMENICYGAIFEVLCGIINCAHDNDLRERVKMVIHTRLKKLYLRDAKNIFPKSEYLTSDFSSNKSAKC